MRKIFLLCIFCISIFSCSFHNEEEETEEIRNRFEAIESNVEFSNLQAVENLITTIKEFEQKYPETPHLTQMGMYKQKLEQMKEDIQIKELSAECDNLLKRDFPNAQEAITAYETVLSKLNTPESTALREKSRDLESYASRLQLIVKELRLVKNFFDQEYSSLYNFNVSAKDFETYTTLHPITRDIWYRNKETEVSHWVTKELRKEIEGFRNYLYRDAGHLCEFLYEGFNVERVDVVSIGEPVEDSKYHAYDCRGIFRVYLRGAFLGWDRGGVKLSLTGRLVATPNDNGDLEIQYKRVDYTILEELGL